LYRSPRGMPTVPFESRYFQRTSGDCGDTPPSMSKHYQSGEFCFLRRDTVPSKTPRTSTGKTGLTQQFCADVQHRTKYLAAIESSLGL